MIITGKKFSKPELSRIKNGDKTLKSAAKKPETHRLDHLLVELYPDFNRSTLQKFVKQGRVKVNGEIIKKPNYQITAADKITADLPDPEKLREKPGKPRLNILFENDFVRVVEKPAGLLSMSKGAFNPEPTLEDYGLLVHRLDRDTSGVVILAKDEATQKFLRKQFQDRKTKKTYHAVVVGRPKLDEALIDLPIARNLKHPTTFLVQAGGKESRTRYKVLAASPRFSLLELRPETGRTHQLRVHLNYLGTPILGDPIYGEKPAKTRLFLHAHALEITIPENSEIPEKPVHIRKTFTSVTPEEFRDVLRADA